MKTPIGMAQQTAPATPPKTTRAGVLPVYQKQFRSLWSAFFVTGLAWGFTIPLMSVIIVDAGVPIHTYGILQSYAALASMLAQMWIGRYSDKLGRRKPLAIISLLLIAPVVAVFPRIEIAFVFGLLLAVHNVAQNALRALNNAWVSTWSAANSLGRLHGTFRIAGSLGWIIATPLLGVVMNRFGGTASFVVSAVLYLVVAAYIALRVPEGASETATSPPPPHDAPGPEPAAPRPRVNGQGSVLIVFFVALAFFYLAQSMGTNLNSIYLKQDLGLSNTHFGWIISVQAWLEVPLMLVFGALSDRFNPRRVLAVGFALSGLRWLLLSWVVSPQWLYPVQALHAVGVTVGEVLAVAFLARYTAGAALGTVLGWKLAVQNATMLLAPTLGGFIAHGNGITTTFRISAALTLVASGLMFLGAPHDARGVTTKDEKGARVGLR